MALSERGDCSDTQLQMMIPLSVHSFYLKSICDVQTSFLTQVNLTQQQWQIPTKVCAGFCASRFPRVEPRNYVYT